MPSLSVPNQLVWFAHCPKTGGTSIEQFMVENWGDAVGHLHWGWDIWWRNGGWRKASPPNSPQHLTWSDAQPELPRSPDVVFTIVRDPIARMVSEYGYQRYHRRSTWLGRNLARIPFSLWLRILLKVREMNAYAFDNHLRPQADFVPENARIFRLEEGLDLVGTWLAGTCGLEGPQCIGRKLHTAHKPGVILSDQDKSLIFKYFKDDFARFSYPAPEAPPHRLGALDVIASLLAFPVFVLERCGQL